MSKDFQFFKDSDGTIYQFSSGLQSANTMISIKDANAKLNREGQTFYSSCAHLGIGRGMLAREWTLDNENRKQEALLICPRPIEKEEPECDHLTLSSTHIKPFKEWKYCPKCGKDLRDE